MSNRPVSPNLEAAAPAQRRRDTCLRSLDLGIKSVKVLFLVLTCYAWLFCFGSLFYTSKTKIALRPVARHIYKNSTLRNNYIPSQAMEINGMPEKQLTLNDIRTCFKIKRFLLKYKKIYVLRRPMTNSFECNHIIYLEKDGIGRTANQMFRVAVLLSFASKNGYTPVISPTLSILKWFDLPNVAYVKLENRNTFRERACCTYDERIKYITHTKNWTLSGFFQSWKYFKGAEHIIRSGLRLKEMYLRMAKRFLNRICRTGTQCISVHVRRGDFVVKANWGFSVAPLTYIHKAMTHFKRKYASTHFIIVSDDKHWCRSYLSSYNVTISPFTDVGIDLAFMAQSDHMIMTSGSFGWWGAWLSGGEVVYWRGYPTNGTWLGNQTKFDDFYPPHWVGLD